MFAKALIVSMGYINKLCVLVLMEISFFHTRNLEALSAMDDSAPYVFDGGN